MWPDDGEPRFIVTSVSGYTIDPRAGLRKTAAARTVPVCYQVLDRAYAHKLVKEFTPRATYGINREARRRTLAERLCADLNQQDAEGLFDRDLTEADIGPGVLA